MSFKPQRKGFTFLELILTISIIILLFSLLLTGIFSSRRAAYRLQCANNLRILAQAFMGFESANGGLPRGGTHLAWLDIDANGNASSGKTLYKVQDFQSPLAMVIPYFSVDVIDGIYDFHYPYNDTRAPQNQVYAMWAVRAFLCPENLLSTYRVSNGGTLAGIDSMGYGITDYSTIPFGENAPGPNGTTLYCLPGALTGAPYPSSFYHNFNNSQNANLPPQDTPATATNPGTVAGTISGSKCVQLDTTINGAYNINGTLTGSQGANQKQIDAYYGLPKIKDIRDGTSYTAILYEDTGRNEAMNGVNFDGTIVGNDYLDPVASSPNGIYNDLTATKRCHWRWADPDNGSSLKRKINNTAGGGMNYADPNPDPSDTDCCFNQSWSVRDCGPNNEAFSFHGDGAHMAFADGHVTFVKQSISREMVQALCTRANSVNEIGLDYTD